MKAGHLNLLTILQLTLLFASLTAHAAQLEATFQDYLPLLDQGSDVRILQTDQADKISFGTISKEIESEQQVTIKDSNQQPLTAPNQTKANATTVVKPLQIKINQVNIPIVGKGFKVDNGVSYQRIHVGQLQKKYLFLNLKLAEKDKWQKAKMSISIEGNQKPLMICTSTDMDSCYITRNLLKNDLILFIQILCEQDCSYGLKGRWSNLEHLFPGQEMIFMFGEDKNQLFHVELNNQEFEEVRIHLSPRATRRPFQNVKMYGKYGSSNDPSQEIYDFKSVNLWQDGEGIFLSSKAMKSKQFTLLIVGQSQTTYRLTCELIKEGMHILQNNQHIYEYMAADSIKKYHVKDIDTQINDEFSFKFSLLSGQAKIQYFKNSQMTEELEIQPAEYMKEYMKDSEYLIPKARIIDHVKDGIFIRVQTDRRDATYTLKYVGRSFKFPIELNEHIYTFVLINKNERFCYFNFKNWLQQTEPEKNLRFTVSMINVFGSVKPSFRVCKSTLDQCVNPTSFNNFTSELTKISEDTISEKRIIQFQIPSSLLTKINSVESQADILVRLQNESTNASFVALEFLNNNKVLYLREGRPLQQKFEAGEIKFYKYVNSDPDVSQIRIHINQIAGIIQMQGLIKSGDNSQSIDVTPESSTLRYTKSLTEPIVLKLTSRTKAIVGISMQVIHKSDQHNNNNIIVIGQDLIYNVKIQSLTYTIFEVVPIFYQFEFLYSSSQSVIACFLDIDTNKCIDDKGKEIIEPGLSTKQKLTTKILKNKKAKVKITNSFANSVAQVSIIFHSRSLDQCQKKKIGKVYHQLVWSSKCFELALEERSEDLEIYISKREFSNIVYTLFLCGNSIQGATSLKFVIINSTTINQSCSKSLQGRKLAIQWNVKSLDNTNNDKVKVDVLVQYKGAVTLLPEGVGYHLSQIATSELLRKFGFIVLNKIATKIIITPIRGPVKAYAKIIKESQREIETISNIDFKFQTAMDVDFRQDPIITISEQDLKQSACVDCMILIAVYSQGQQGKSVEFDIQVVQKVQSLNDNTGTTGYLQAKSYAYYTYEVDRDINSSLIFVVSDHNERCVNLYLGVVQYPSSQSKLAASQGSFLIYKHTAGNQRYFLTVQSTAKACEYSLSVLDAETSILNLQRGKQVLVQLNKGGVQLFTFDHYSGPFKIFAISKFGEVRFHLNQSNLELNKKSFTTKEIAYEKFAYKSEQFNVIAVSSKRQVYCTQCSYFLAVQALQNTYSTLFLAYTQTIIPLIHKKYFSDYLEKKSDLTLLSYKRIEKTQLQVTVHKGQIEIIIFYKETRLSQTYSAKSQHQFMLIDVKKDLTTIKKPAVDVGKKNETVRYVQKIPINIVITAKADDSTYTLQATSVEKQSLANVAAFQDILAGQPNHIKISSEKVLCLNGYFRDIGEEIIIHTNQENHQKLSDLIVDAKINKIEAKVQKSMVKNMLTLNVTYNSTKYQGAAYQICLKYNDEQTESNEEKHLKDSSVEKETQDSQEASFNAIVTQINTVNLLPSDSEFIVKGTSTFTINHDGQFLLQVFECEAEGQAKIQYGKSLVNAQKSKGKSLESIGIEGQEHAIKISQEETTTYVIVNSKFSVVRWLPIDTSVDEGTGYLKFKSGDLRYTSKFKHIYVEYQPIQTVKESKVQTKIAEYTLLISNDSDKLTRLSRCDKADQIGVMVIPLGVTNYEPDNQKQYLSYDLDKNLLQSSFPVNKNIYMVIVAKLTVSFSQTNKKEHKFKNPSSDEHEHYRFIYSRQQMPLESFKQSKIESIPYHFLLLIVLSIAGLFLLLSYLLTRKIIPMLARLKNSNLVEEKEQQAEPELAQVPPSSDRNQRAVDVVIETEDKFAK